LTKGVGDADSLWLERNPSVEEIKLALEESLRKQDAKEIVFCGYGEPMMRANVVINISKYIKDNFSSLYEKPAPLVRVNTNGLAFLMHPDFDVSQLAVVDTVSISLTADDNEEYQRLSRPMYGRAAYPALLAFAKQAKEHTQVVFSIVEGTLPKERVKNCIKIASDMGIELRIREME